MDLDRLAKLEERLRPATPLRDWTHINTSEPDAVDRLHSFGIRPYGTHIDNGHDFFVRVPSSQANNFSIQLHMAEDCTFIIEEPAHYHAHLVVIGAGNVFATSGTPNMPGMIELRAEFHGYSNTVIFGEGSTSNGTRIVVQGGATVDIRKDCMFADGVTIRATDNHAMFDITTGNVVNPPSDVVIGPHVWLGQEVLVLSGTRIGPGSILGARALVSRSLPAAVLAVGTPAAVVRSGVSWTRTLYPGEADRIDALQYLYSEK